MRGVFLRPASKAKTAVTAVAATVAAVACLGLATPAQAAEVYNLTYKADANEWTYPEDVPTSLKAGDQVNITFEFTNQHPQRYHGNRILLNRGGNTTYNEGGPNATVDYSYGDYGTIKYTYTATKDTPLTIAGWNVEQLYNCHPSEKYGLVQIASVQVTVDERDSHTISYVTNGGSEVESTEAPALPEELPVTTREGAEFEGWYTDEACTEEAVPGAEITEDVTLYAKWSHAHDWVFEGDDNGTLAYYCDNDVLADECERNGRENALTLTVKDYQNPFTDEEKAAWEAAGLPLPELSYRLSDGTLTTPENSGAETEGGVPTKPGKYSLWVIGEDGAVATYGFEVPEAKKDDPKTEPKTDNNDSNTKTVAKTSVPKTGDTAAPVAAVLGVGCVAAVAGLIVKAKRQ